jgi:hypothetical protein
MQLLHEFPAGTVLFTAPTAEGKRKELPGISWPVRVYIDYPLPKPVLNYAATSGCSMQFSARVAGAPAAILFDSGASHSYISEAFVRRIGLRMHDAADDLEHVTLADGTTAPIQGVCSAHISLQHFRASAELLVVSLDDAYDLILGDAWLQQYGAVLDFGTRNALLKKGTTIHTLRPRMPPAQRAVPTLDKAILSAVQFCRAAKSGCKLFAVHVEPVDDVPSSLTLPAEPSAPSAGIPVEDIAALKQKYAAVFSDPPGLPPVRNVGHTIPVEPGSSPPFRAMYRLSPAERDEVQRPARTGLDRAFLFPVWCPCPFCAEKGWFFAHVHRLPCAE